MNIVVCALYKFVRLENYRDLRTELLDHMLSKDIKGTLLLAREGINGTVAGTRDNIDSLLNLLREDPRLADLEVKESRHDHSPFLRSKVKLKKEIVTMGVEDIDPNQSVGTYVDAKQWNQLLRDPEVTVIDTRNHYEVEIGSFINAIDPHTETFREFPAYARENLNPSAHKKVAMFCTGGIRCEKSTAFLKEQGFDEVYHLKGGILKYLETVEPGESLWQGECFVFDDRVSVNSQLEKGQYDQCFACRYPITQQDKEQPEYQQGVSCPRCYSKLTDTQRERFAEREKQIRLAEQRGKQHLGAQ